MKAEALAKSGLNPSCRQIINQPRIARLSINMLAVTGDIQICGIGREHSDFSPR